MVSFETDSLFTQNFLLDVLFSSVFVQISMSFDARSNRPIVCPFCDERLSTVDDMRIHLEECASKTNQCPICKRHIQRSIFAYHTYNACANPNLHDQVKNERMQKHPNELLLLGA